LIDDFFKANQPIITICALQKNALSIIKSSLNHYLSCKFYIRMSPNWKNRGRR